MRSLWLVGVAALAIASGVVGASAQPLVDQGWRGVRRHHHRSYVATYPLQSGRAAFSDADAWRPVRPMQETYHDPNFSTQQDDAYAQRFP